MPFSRIHSVTTKSRREHVRLLDRPAVIQVTEVPNAARFEAMEDGPRRPQVSRTFRARTRWDEIGGHLRKRHESWPSPRFISGTLLLCKPGVYHNVNAPVSWSECA